VLKARVPIGGSKNKEVKDTNLPRKSHWGSLKKETPAYPQNPTVFVAKMMRFTMGSK
jgi:hypothetical protein